MQRIITNKQVQKLLEDKRGMTGTIMLLVGVSIGLLILSVVLDIGPVVGYNVVNSVSIPATSSWSSATNTGITNGSELWATNTPMISAATIVVIVAVIIAVLLVAMGAQRREGGGAV